MYLLIYSFCNLIKIEPYWNENISTFVAIIACTSIKIEIEQNTIIKFINKPYPIVLGNFMLLLGAYFLLSAIVIPNIASALTKTTSPITIGSPQDILMVILSFAILIIGGMILTKKGRNILD